MARDGNLTFRDYINGALAEQYAIEDEDGKRKKLTGMELLVMRLFNAAAKGDWTAWKLVYEISGQKLQDSATGGIDPGIIAEVEQILHEEQEKKQS